MTRGLLLIDVDGPLNPWAEKPCRRPSGYTTHRLRPKGWEHERKPLRVWLNPSHGELLTNLAQDIGFDLVWCTTWQHEANTMIGPVIGLPELPVIQFNNNPCDTAQWKYPAVLEYAAGRPLVWLDDDFTRDAYRAASIRFERDRGEIPTLLHQVSPRIGLTVEDITEIRSWAAAWTTTTPWG